MKLSAQEEYGLRCLLFMARHGETKSHSIPEISRAEGLSVPNVAKLMRILRLGGLVASVRGQAGGYTLSRPADQVTVSEILSLLGGSFFNSHFCDRHSGLERNCAHTGDCAVRLLWGAVQKSLDAILTKTTLRDLLRNEEEMIVFLKNHGATVSSGEQTLAVHTITN
ncbi:Rrf2 family transcriptional regulator [uncultured Paludibaculum sp.]|uniref:RrF2 family transcriptional regulator n=1 Tax=uncultured Paludibaculum sp. TaxID=1765020 RepID=UPI002AAAD9AC|nr:Rrf2 family transcriptional regulator [uncultured Paludibaculum sp.]